MEDLTGKQLGSYQLVAPLGEGGMAVVYKAYQPSTERYVALKILPSHFAADPEFVRRFKQEAKIIAGLEHPNILPVYDYGESDGYTYIVMRYVEKGKTLADLLRGKPLPVAKACDVLSKLAGALDYAHSRGVVHRDVKPSNVLIDQQGNLLLSDFGLAKMFTASSKLTASGAFLGTPTYASPEQCLGRDKLDGRSDVYSLGVMLYEMATGRPPYDADTPMAVVVKHINDPLPLPRKLNPGLPESVERVILKALAKDREDRYQTAGKLARALEAAALTRQVDLAPTVAEPGKPDLAETVAESIEVPPLAPARKRRLSAWAWVAGSAVVLLLVAFVPRLIRSFGTGARPASSPAFHATAGGVQLPASPAVPTASLAPSASPTVPTPTSGPWESWTQAKSFPAPGDSPSGIVRVGDSLWVNVPCSNRTYRVNLEGEIMGELQMPRSGCGPRNVGLAWDGTSLWGIWWSRVIQIDPDTGRSLSEFMIDMDGRNMTWDGSYLWIVDLNSNLVAYDRTGQRQRRMAIPGSGMVSAIAWVEGELWVLDGFGQVTRYDGDLLEVGSFSLVGSCGISSFHEASTFGLYWDGESLWVADAIQNRIFQCTPGE